SAGSFLARRRTSRNGRHPRRGGPPDAASCLRRRLAGSIDRGCSPIPPRLPLRTVACRSVDSNEGGTNDERRQAELDGRARIEAHQRGQAEELVHGQRHRVLVLMTSVEEPNSGSRFSRLGFLKRAGLGAGAVAFSGGAAFAPTAQAARSATVATSPTSFGRI